MTKWLSLWAVMFFIAGCQYEEVKPAKRHFPNSALAINSPSVATSGGKTVLNIPNLNWDTFTPGVHQVGWCGEASLQMIALYYGRYYSQRVINQLGQPKQLDLYADEIEPVIKKLGFNYLPYTNPPERSAAHYLAWVKQRLTQGLPVFSGVKSVPYGNPDWSLDHFVVLTGYGLDQVLYNSNRASYGQVWIADDAFTAATPPYSLSNRQNRYFGFALTGFHLSPRYPVQLFVLAEDAEQVDLGIHAEGLSVNHSYQLWRQVIYPVEGQKTMLKRFVAGETWMTEKDLQLGKHLAYRYWLEEAD